MGTRRQAREWALQFLFQRDFNSGEIDAALADFWHDKQADDGVRRFTEELIRGVESNLREIDAFIQKYTDHWDVKRMGAVDRNVIRTALYEMLKRDDVPPIVSINEAVDIAKSYSSNESGKFVNGILDRALRDIRRPHRHSSVGERG